MSQLKKYKRYNKLFRTIKNCKKNRKSMFLKKVKEAEDRKKQK